MKPLTRRAWYLVPVALVRLRLQPVAAIAHRPVRLPENASRAVWHLDPDQPAPGPDATSFTAIVTERACSSARDIRGNLLRPVIQYLEPQVTVSLYIEPLPPGEHECPGNPPTPFVIELAEPLGDRSSSTASAGRRPIVNRRSDLIPERQSGRW